jgi:hypothetical protein
VYRPDPGDLALYALIGVALVSLGAILTGTTEQFSIADRGTVLGGIVAVLAGIAYFVSRSRRKKDE